MSADCTVWVLNPAINGASPSTGLNQLLEKINSYSCLSSFELDFHQLFITRRYMRFEVILFIFPARLILTHACWELFAQISAKLFLSADFGSIERTHTSEWPMWNHSGEELIRRYLPSFSIFFFFFFFGLSSVFEDSWEKPCQGFIKVFFSFLPCRDHDTVTEEQWPWIGGWGALHFWILKG